MKTFSEFLLEEKHKENEIPEFFAHYRSGKDKKHDLSSTPKEDETAEFFAHYRSGKDKKHDPLDEDFMWHTVSNKSRAKSRAELRDNVASLDHHKDLTKEETKSDNNLRHHLSEYTEQSTDLNQSLIKKKKLNKRHAEQAASLDRITNNPKNSLKKSIKTYSGLGAKFAKTLSKVKPGQHIKCPAYISSSVDHDIARNFSHNATPNNGNKEHHHFIQFDLPKGYKRGRYIHNKYHENPGEHEFLMARGQTFKKTKERKIETYNPDFHVTVHHLEPVED